jgi:transposase
MWTPTTRQQHSRTVTRYQSDLTGAEWRVIAPHLPKPCATGRPRAWPMREIVNGIFYVMRAGCPWRLLPNDLPPWGTIYRWFAAWRDDGCFERINHALVMVSRGASSPSSSASSPIADMAEAVRHHRGLGYSPDAVRTGRSRTGRARRQPYGSNHRQPERQDHRGRRPTRLRCYKNPDKVGFAGASRPSHRITPMVRTSPRPSSSTSRRLSPASILSTNSGRSSARPTTQTDREVLESLSPQEREVVEEIMWNNPGISAQTALERLRLGGM